MLDKIRDFKAKVCNPEAHLNNMASHDKEFKRMWKRDNIGCGNNDSNLKNEIIFLRIVLLIVAIVSIWNFT